MVRLVSHSKSYTIKSAFGENFTYNIFAVKSQNSFFRFIDTIGKQLKLSFSYMTTQVLTTDEHEGKFRVAMALHSSDEEVCCYIMENKTYNYKGCNFLKSNKEKNCTFQTLSLFEEMLYFINMHGLAMHREQIANYDYLILSVMENGYNINIENFEHQLMQKSTFTVQNISNILTNTSSKKKKEPLSEILKDLFYQLEIYKREFLKTNKRKNLSLRTTIPVENIDHLFLPPLGENETRENSILYPHISPTYYDNNEE